MMRQTEKCVNTNPLLPADLVGIPGLITEPTDGCLTQLSMMILICSNTYKIEEPSNTLWD
jgi:hypothetical protein